MIAAPRYRLTISRRGPPPRPFGWEICRSDGTTELARSGGTFRSRHEAIADGEREAAALERSTPDPTVLPFPR